MKKSLIPVVFIFSLLLMNFASALSLSETLSFIDPSLITLAIIFVVFFGAFFASVSKIFKGNTSVSAIIAIALSFLLVYWFNNLFSLGTLFSGWGLSDETLYTIGPLLFIAMMVFLFIKLRFVVFIVLGGVLVLAAATGLVYSGGLLTIIGIGIIGIGVLGTFSKKGRLRSIIAKIRKIQRKYGQNDPRIRALYLKGEKIQPGFSTVKT